MPWLLFLLCVAGGVLVLGTDAPGAVPGGFGSGRLLVFGYRLAWYLACTALLLWLVNTSRSRLPDRTVHGIVGSLCLVATVGGLIGMAWPHLAFTSPVEAVLPHGLRSNAFVGSLVHPEVADVQQVLGRAEARPKAPFAFTNTWGSVLALSTVYVVAWAGGRGRAARVGVAALLLVALVPAVHSLNRGLWACLLLGALAGTALALRRGRGRHLLVGAVVVGLVGLVLLGPLVSIVGERLAHQHSNERRGSLAATTISSVTSGSPIIGFGSTRDVQGSFASIAGGSRPDCPACGVPPLGTQGHLWLVLFSQGWLGVALFLSTLACALARCWRCRTTNETLATVVLAMFAVQLFVYDTLGLPLLMVAIAVGLVAREQRGSRPLGALRTGRQLRERLRTAAPATVALVALGAAGAAVAAHPAAPRDQATRVHVALTLPPDPYSVPAVTDLVESRTLPRRELRMTLDTEAALLLSERTLSNAAATLGTQDPGVTVPLLRDSIGLAAEPHTQILLVTARAGSAAASRARALAVVDSYLATRRSYVSERRNDLLARLRQDLRRVLPWDQSSQVLIGRLTSADARVRATPDDVGRVVAVDPARTVPGDLAVRTTSGAALGLLVGAGLTAVRRRRTHAYEGGSR